MEAILKNRERAHLRLLAIQLVSEDKIADAQILLAQLLTDPDPLAVGTCMFCKCTHDHPCGILVETPDGFIPARCSWMDDQRTLCSNTRCVRMYEQLHPELVQTSARGLVLP